MHTDPCLCPGRPRQMMEVGDRVWIGERVNLLCMDLSSWFKVVTMWSRLKAFSFQLHFWFKSDEHQISTLECQGFTQGKKPLKLQIDM